MGLSSIAFFLSAVGVYGFIIILIVALTVFTTPWYDQLKINVKNAKRSKFFAFLSALAVLASILGKPFSTVSDMWSDRATLTYFVSDTFKSPKIANLPRF